MYLTFRVLIYNSQTEFVLRPSIRLGIKLRSLRGRCSYYCMFRDPLAPVKNKDDLASYTKSISTWFKFNSLTTQYITSDIRV